jgi:hypothetical protein
MFMAHGLSRFAPAAQTRRAILVLCALFSLALAAHAQQPQPTAPQPHSTQPPAQNTPAPDTAQPASASAPAQAAPAQVPAQTPATDTAQPPTAQQPAPLPAAVTPAAAPESKSEPALPGGISEEELKQQLVGKQFYLRGGYLGDSITFNERGRIIGHSPQGSYTLSIIQIDRVHLTKHKVELEGIRYGIHFNEQLAYEDSSTASDKVRITPKKKVVRLTIDREMVVNPKKKKEPAREKEKGKEKAKVLKPAMPPATSTTPAAAAPATQPSAPPAASEAAPAQTASAASPDDTTQAPAAAPATTEPATSVATPPAASGTAPNAGPVTTPASAAEPAELSEADQLKASIAAAPAAERPADPTSVTTTTSQSHANRLLLDALDAIFAPGLDERMMAAMPDFWKLYYQAVAAKADYRPADPAILRQNTVDQKAHLLTAFEPDSNEFAQAAGVAGMALYHTVIGADGRPGEIAVARPIGFGLDESAVASIRKAKFSPAVKGGQPVPVLLDLVVQFRIFSKRTAAVSAPDPAEKDKPAEPVLPGPYSVPHPASSPQPQPNN